MLKQGQKVKCVRGHPGVLEAGKVYTVAVIISTGVDYHGAISDGVIVDPRGNPEASYPFVWDTGRFEPV